jgi:hypothetical protein
MFKDATIYVFLVTSINSYKYIFNPIKNTLAILLTTAKIAICSAISLREPITFELDDDIPALYQINTLSQVTHKLNKA